MRGAGVHRARADASHLARRSRRSGPHGRQRSRRRLRCARLRLPRKCRGRVGRARTGRAVKWLADRTELFLCDVHGRDQLWEAELALDQDYKFTALRIRSFQRRRLSFLLWRGGSGNVGRARVERLL